MRLYTGHGDDGTTGLLFGGRVPKDAPEPEAVGAVDEAQAALGLIRCELASDDEAWAVLLRIQRDLYVLMAELATLAEHRHRLEPDSTRVSEAMFARLVEVTDAWAERLELGKDFVVPGENRVAALFDLARTVVRRAERRCIAVAADGSLVVPYLNRLSSLLWAGARLAEQTHRVAKDRSP